MASAVLDIVPVGQAADVSHTAEATPPAFTPAGIVTFGFATTNVAQFLGLTEAQAEATQRAALNIAQTPATQAALATINPANYAGIQAGYAHMAQHPEGSHYHGNFNPVSWLSNVVGIMTFGVVNLSGAAGGNLGKIQVNVPGSPAEFRSYVTQSTDFYTAQQLDKPIAQFQGQKSVRLAEDVGVAATDIAAGGAIGYAAFGAGAETVPVTASFSETLPLETGAAGELFAGTATEAASLSPEVGASVSLSSEAAGTSTVGSTFSAAKAAASPFLAITAIGTTIYNILRKIIPGLPALQTIEGIPVGTITPAPSQPGLPGQTFYVQGQTVGAGGGTITRENQPIFLGGGISTGQAFALVGIAALALYLLVRK